MATNSSPGVSPLDLVPPRRPGTSDFNGCAKIDDANYPPDFQTMPSAAEYNELCLLAVATNKVVSNLVISIKYVTGAPVLDSWTSLGNNPTSATFTIARTGGGASSGDITITWPANTFPVQTTQPEASLNGIVPGMIAVSAVTNGIRVVTVNGSNAATDLPFTACAN